VNRLKISRAQKKKLASLIQDFGRVRLLVIGDLILDQFIWGNVNRISPEAPVPVVQVTSESYRLGGAANVVHNIRAMGGKVSLCGVVGADPMGRNLKAELRKKGIGLEGIVTSRRMVTTHKIRILAHNQQVVRLDRENAHKPGGSAARRIGEFIQRNYEKFDALIISDYGKGVVDGSLLAAMLRLRKEKGALVVVDPKGPNFDLYSGATLITPNQVEAEVASGIEIRDGETLRKAGRRLVEKWKAEAVLITQGNRGMSLFVKGRPPAHIPTAAREVYDVTGAGDTVVAACSLGLAAGGDFADAAMLANLAAGVAVAEVGTVAVSRDELFRALSQ
jgi:D-beta-D-heptose 7-phosphate kinase/D-beta-D-heptose 1-phosphate adenosyltransferase